MKSVFAKRTAEGMIRFAAETGKIPGFIFLGSEEFSSFAEWVKSEYGEGLGDMIDSGWEPQFLDAKVFQIDTDFGVSFGII